MNATGTPANLLDRERSALDLPVAGLAALAVAFAAFTIPDALLGRAVEAAGLPSVLSAAQPPLGNTARLLMAVAGAVVAFALAFALLRWLDRFAARPPLPATAEPSPDAPRIHRADAHPDAPPRRPISAARDLGEPAPPARPHPATEQPAVQEPAQEPAPFELDLRAPAPPPVEPVIRAAPSATLTDLMARLERGLARREPGGAEPQAGEDRGRAAPPREPAFPPVAAPAPPAPSNDRLQNAIEGLRALSARA